MGQRGKKRRRADGSIASGKLAPPRHAMPMVVPEVEFAHMKDGYDLWSEALREARYPTSGEPAWLEAYTEVQSILRIRYGEWPGDAVLWRACFLESLMRYPEFLERHEREGALPTVAMIQVAAVIYTDGADRCFDDEIFENMLPDFEEIT